MEKIVIGVDPHKLSATIEVVDHHDKVLTAGRFSTDKAGYSAMRRHVAAWPHRVWAVEGSNGAGRSLAQRLLADGEHVVDVPAKLAARARVLDTGHGRKTDAHDAAHRHFGSATSRTRKPDATTGPATPKDQRPQGRLTTEGSRKDVGAGRADGSRPDT